MKNNTFVKLVAVLLVAVLSAGLFSVASFAEEKVISDGEYTDLSYDNGTVIVKVEAARLSEIIQKREFTKDALLKLLPTELYNIYQNRTKESVVDFLCLLAEKEVLMHSEMLRLFNEKGEILDKYLPPEYWVSPTGGEATQAEVADNIRNAGGSKLKKDVRNFFVQTLLNEVDVMTCNGTEIFKGDPVWEFDHNAIQTVVLKSLPDVQKATELKDGDALLDLAFSSTGPNVNLEFGFKVIITGDCTYINENAQRFADEITYVVEDSGTVNATVTFNDVFAQFYADALNSDKFTKERKFELLGVYTLSGTDLMDFITNEEIDELVAFGSIVSEERAAQIESFRDLLTKILKALAKLAPKSDTVEAFTTIADNYQGNGVFTYTIHEEFSFEDLVNKIADRFNVGDKLPEEWADLISKDMHIIDQTTTLNIANFYRVRYFDANDQLLYITFMPVGFDLSFLNDAAELQGHGADGWYDERTLVTEMPEKDVDLYEVQAPCQHTYGDPTWEWSEDYSSAKATFVCTNCNDTVTLDATVTSEEDTENGKIIYTAKVTFQETEYTDTKSKDIPPCEHTYGEPTWEWSEDYTAAKATFTCTKCGETVTLDATVTTEEDTENGKIIHTAEVTFEGTTYTDIVTEDIPPCEHTYDEPVWEWADDYSSATATFKCTKCGEEETLTATITSEEDKENNQIVYTATVTFNGTVYTDTVNVAIVTPPPTGESYVWFAVAGAALIASAACSVIIIRRKNRVL